VFASFISYSIQLLWAVFLLLHGSVACVGSDHNFERVSKALLTGRESSP
jgi:hypothetical protein